MKVCPACHEIVSANQRCALSYCPNQDSVLNADRVAKVVPGPTGRTDRLVQAGLDRAGDVARDATRRAAFAIASVFLVVLATVVIGFNTWSGTDNASSIIVTVSEEANVRSAPTADGSTVLETLPPGTKLTGRWVDGSTVPSERWFEIEKSGKFLWSGNLRMESAVIADAAINKRSPANAMAYAGKYPSERIDGYGVFDAPDLQAAVKGMPEGNQIWAQITSESRVLDVESPNRVSDGGQSIVIQKCEAHNCGGPSSRQLVLKYFTPSNGRAGQAAVCLKNGARRQIYLSWGIGDLGPEMPGDECSEESFDYLD